MSRIDDSILDHWNTLEKLIDNEVTVRNNILHNSIHQNYFLQYSIITEWISRRNICTGSGCSIDSTTTVTSKMKEVCNRLDPDEDVGQFSIYFEFCDLLWRIITEWIITSINNSTA